MYYVAAGLHQFQIDQSNTVGADWSVAISGPTADTDTLPYHRAGNSIGGTINKKAPNTGIRRAASISRRCRYGSGLRNRGLRSRAMISLPTR